jgi:V/A-type H+-transporting ATPase subunit D
MEMQKLKARLKTAQKGHKLLKDKRDELMRQFLDLVRRNRQLRAEVEQALTQVHNSFTVASAVMSPEMLEQALSYPKQSVELDVSFRNVMSVNVPNYTFHTKNDDPAEIYPYGFAQTSGELDDALDSLSKVFNDMLELAQVEKATQLMAQEIEKTRRRVNALEYVMIPQYQEKIKYISMKLDENERSTTARLMKVKDMLLEEEREKAEAKRLAREAEKHAQA